MIFIRSYFQCWWIQPQPWFSFVSFFIGISVVPIYLLLKHPRRTVVILLNPWLGEMMSSYISQRYFELASYNVQSIMLVTTATEAFPDNSLYVFLYTFMIIMLLVWLEITSFCVIILTLLHSIKSCNIILIFYYLQNSQEITSPICTCSAVALLGQFTV